MPNTLFTLEVAMLMKYPLHNYPPLRVLGLNMLRSNPNLSTHRSQTPAKARNDKLMRKSVFNLKNNGLG